jgi:anti-sigma factor RsiW
MAVNSENQNPEREKLLQLMPWRVSGRLDREQSAELQRALAADPELHERLAAMREEAAETIAVNEQLGRPSAASFDRLMAEIAALDDAAARRPSLGDRIGAWLGWLSAPSRAPVWAAAAAVVIVLQAGAIGYMLSRDTSPGFETAAGGPQAVSGPHVLAVFSGDAKLGEINELLARFQTKIKDGPSVGGVYRIVFEDAKAGKSDIDRLISALMEAGLAITALPGHGE